MAWPRLDAYQVERIISRLQRAPLLMLLLLELPPLLRPNLSLLLSILTTCCIAPNMKKVRYIPCLSYRYLDYYNSCTYQYYDCNIVCRWLLSFPQRVRRQTSRASRRRCSAKISHYAGQGPGSVLMRVRGGVSGKDGRRAVCCPRLMSSSSRVVNVRGEL